MTDDVAILLNLVTLAESGEADFRLEISRTMFRTDGHAVKRVYVDGTQVAEVNAYELLDAAADWPVLRLDSLRRYVRGNEPSRRIARRRGFED